MAVIFISILTIFLLFYILTRVIWIRIVSEERIKLEIHLPILSIKIVNDTDGGNAKKKPRENEHLSIVAYIRIISAVIQKIHTSRIEINRIAIPLDKQKLTKGNFFGPIGYQYAIFGVIAYLNTKTEKLTIEDNAIILSPDIKKAQFYITVKPRMYELIFALITYKIQLYREKKRA